MTDNGSTELAEVRSPRSDVVKSEEGAGWSSHGNSTCRP
jgi:hypothetical protein